MEKRAPNALLLTPDRFIPHGRPIHSLSTRNCAGDSPRGNGHRVDGCMFLRIRHAYNAHKVDRGLEVNEALTVGELYDIISLQTTMEHGWPPPRGCAIDPQFGQGLSMAGESTNVPVTSLFNGGETIVVRVYDEDGREWQLDKSGTWSCAH